MPLRWPLGKLSEQQMAKAVICEGDPTSHGGKVLEGLSSATIAGKRIAARGHKVSCPLCNGTFPIVEGVPFHTFAGLGTAVEGMRTACGATLIATQHSFTIDVDGIPGSMTRSDNEANTGSSTTALNSITERFDQHFLIVDQQGRPLPHLLYTIRTESGEGMRGKTSSEGMTSRLEAKSPMQLSITVFEETTPINPNWDR